MTTLQRIQYEIFVQFIQVCETLNLTYYLVCGSALGAAKYNGFIPWDDDLDVALIRSEYDTFCREAPHLLPEHYFVQTYMSEPAYPNLFCKIRDSRTTFIEKSVKHLNLNHGVYIDVFPLDGYPADKKEAKHLERIKKVINLQRLCALELNSRQKKSTWAFILIGRCLGFHKYMYAKLLKLEEEISKYPTSSSEIWCNHGNWQGVLEYAPKWHYCNGTWANFEGLKVRIPKDYDAYLTQKYGDWRADLPEDQKVGHHYYEVCDLTRPYTDYIEKLPNGKIRIKKPEELEPQK